MEEVGQFINTVGFPIFVSVFFMFRLEKTIKKTNDISGQLLTYLQKLNGRAKL